jgi:hypothetical protein
VERTLVRFVFFFLFGVGEKKEGVGSEGGLGKKAKGERGEGTGWLAGNCHYLLNLKKISGTAQHPYLHILYALPCSTATSLDFVTLPFPATNTKMGRFEVPSINI